MNTSYRTSLTIGIIIGSGIHQCFFLINLHHTSIPHSLLISTPTRYRHFKFSATFHNLLCIFLPNLWSVSFSAIWVCLKFELECFPRFSKKRVGTLFMPWYFPELKSNTRLCLTFRGRRLCSSFSNDSVSNLSYCYYYFFMLNWFYCVICFHVSCLLPMPTNCNPCCEV